MEAAYFLSFCIEQYKHRKGMSGSDVMTLFDRYGLSQYLTRNYEALHTQSREHVTDKES